MKINIFLIMLFFLNLIQSYFTGLSFDESYYWIYSDSFKFGHFDHPPMVGWIIGLGTSIFGKNEFAVRFFFSLMHVVGVKLLWEMTNKKSLITFIACVMSQPLFISAGFLAIPDSPLVFFAILFLYYIKKYLAHDSWKNTFALSCIIPLLFYSKYHGLVVVLLTLLGHLKFLKRKSFWLIVLMTLIFYLPHMYWQYLNEFITFKFHLFGRKEHHFKMLNILDYMGGQVILIGLFTAPFILYVISKAEKDSFNKILKYNLWGLYLLLLISSLRNKIEANWTATSTIMIIILVTNYFGIYQKHKKKFLISAIPFISILLLLRGYFIFAPTDPIAPRVFEVYKWETLAEKINKIANGQRIIANNYQIAAKLSFYNNRFVHALHHNTRKSEFSLIRQDQLPDENTRVTFVSYRKFPNSVTIDIGYPAEIYVTPNISIKEIKEH